MDSTAEGQLPDKGKVLRRVKLPPLEWVLNARCGELNRRVVGALEVGRDSAAALLRLRSAWEAAERAGLEGAGWVEDAAHGAWVT